MNKKFKNIRKQEIYQKNNFQIKKKFKRRCIKNFESQ